MQNLLRNKNLELTSLIFLIHQNDDYVVILIRNIMECD
jgi:hypothetical protein